MHAVRRLALAALAALALPAVLVAAQPVEPDALDSMIAAERAFARASVEAGMKAAFLGSLADDAVLFRGAPVNGIAWWRSRPESPAVLEWAPAYAEVSGDGDLGFSTGPWSLRPKAGEAPVAFGHFVSVWRRPPGGSWRVALDIGIGHPDPKTPLDRVTVSRGPVHLPPDSNAGRASGLQVGAGVRSGNVGIGVGNGGVGIGVSSGGFGVGVGFGGGIRGRRDYAWRRTAHEKNTLMGAERAFAFEARKHGWDRAYRLAAANDLRGYREGAPPSLGHDAAIAAAAGVPVTREWITRGHAVATSWDLGYTYGIAIARPAAGAPRGTRPDTASFAHLWRKDDAGRWRLALDVENPFPKPSK